MKRLFLLSMLMLTTLLTAQNQTFTGVKTFASPPKFNNLVQNDANTKVLTINATNVLQWKNTSTFGISEAPSDGQNYVRNNNTWQVASSGTTPTLQQVLNAGDNSELTGSHIRVTNGPSTEPNYAFAELNRYGFLSFLSGGITQRPTSIGYTSFTNGDSYANYGYGNYVAPIGGALTQLKNGTNANTIPTPTSFGYKGEIRVISGYLYLCTSTDFSNDTATWVRSSVETTW